LNFSPAESFPKGKKIEPFSVVSVAMPETVKPVSGIFELFLIFQ
jgi:hypothetical protein